MCADWGWSWLVTGLACLAYHHNAHGKRFREFSTFVGSIATRSRLTWPPRQLRMYAGYANHPATTSASARRRLGTCASAATSQGTRYSTVRSTCHSALPQATNVIAATLKTTSFKHVRLHQQTDNRSRIGTLLIVIINKSSAGHLPSYRQPRMFAADAIPRATTSRTAPAHNTMHRVKIRRQNNDDDVASSQ